MSTTHLWLAAAAAFAGAVTPTGVPVWVGVAMLVANLATRQHMLVAVALLVLCSGLAHRAWSGLDYLGQAEVAGEARVVVDPERQGRQTTAVVKIGDTRYLASAYGANATRLLRLEAGDGVQLSGTTKPYSGYRRAANHVAARLVVTSVGDTSAPNALYLAANAVRSTLSGGADVLSPDRKALFTGLVYGDDRNQPPLVAADFRTAGLTHLLAVSGQNVAYVLMLAAPLLLQLDRHGRWLVSLAVLLLFATITRFEPSVLRATVMAALAVTGRMRGHETPSGRMLAGSVVALLVVDPLLASTVAFQLSVAASAGIVGLQPLVAAQLRGPRWVVEPLAVTVAAQLAVAPILVTTFGPISLVSIPANMVAGPIAGGVMAWGMTAGLVAGIGPDWLAEVIHAPTNLAVMLLETIAWVAASAPLAPVGVRWLALALVAAAVFKVSRHWPAGTLRPFVWLRWALATTLMVALLPLQAKGGFAVGRDAYVWSDGTTAVLVLTTQGSEPWVVEDLRNARIRDLDLVVVAPGAVASARALGTRIPIAAVLELEPSGVEVTVKGRALIVGEGQIIEAPQPG